MSDFTFYIPFQKEELRNAENINQYVVDEVYSSKQISRKLEEFLADESSVNSETIFECFDLLYSFICKFPEDESTVKEGWRLTILVSSHVVQTLQSTLEGGAVPYDARKKLLNMLKMTCYVLCQMVEAIEKESTSSSQETVAPTGRGKKKTQSKKSKFSDWDHTKVQGIEYLQTICELPIQYLWEPPIVEEEFVSLVTNCCYKVLENPSISKNTDLKNAVFHIIGLNVKKYSHNLSCILKLTQLLQSHDHTSVLFADAVQLLAERYCSKSFVGEIIREISQLDIFDNARDSASTRNVSQFLTELAHRNPGLILQYMSLLTVHLSSESYVMRNCVLTVMGDIVLKELSSEELDQKSKELRDQLLDRLEDHIHDINAFVRSKSLQIWQQLCAEKAIPLTRQKQLLELVIGRLKDKSSIVRKNAVQFLVSFLQGNPFTSKFSVEELEGNLAQAEDVLREMLAGQELEEPLPDDPVIRWEKFKVELVKVLEKDRENENFQAPDKEATSLSEIIQKIKDLLEKMEYEEAVNLASWAMENYEDFPGPEQPSDDPMDSSNEESEDLLSEQLLYALKVIYLGEETEKEGSQPNTENNEDDENKDNVPKNIVNEVSKQQVLVQYLKDCVTFAKQIQGSLMVLCDYLSSKTASDVLEAINFFVTAFEFGLHEAIVGVRKMLLLIWSKETAIKEAVVTAYKRLYIDSNGSNERNAAAVVAKNLCRLVEGATCSEILSFEELVVQLVKSGDITSAVIQILWEKFSMKIPDTTPRESQISLLLLSMAAGSEIHIVKQNLEVLVSVGLGARAKEDWDLCQYTCKTLIKLAGSKKPSAEDKEAPFHFSETHEIFTSLKEILVETFMQPGNTWIPMMEHAVNVIYKISDHPDTVISDIMKGLVKQFHGSDNDLLESAEDQEKNGNLPNSQALVRLIAFTGHIALQQLIYLDVSVFTELKRRQTLEENEKEKSKRRKQARRSTATTLVTPKNKDEPADDEMGMVGAVADDADAEYIVSVLENEVLSAENILGALHSLVVNVVSNPQRFSDIQLQTVSSVALSKIMMLSSVFCEENLPLLFTLLEKSPEPLIRANIIISLADLAIRFPNLIEPWTSKIYCRLRDPSIQVRKNVLKVLSHLILNDMIKVKGQISDLALCTVDQEESISNLAKAFFAEFSRKGHGIYNILPDVISRLSDEEHGTEEENFRIIMKYLFSFMEKDRQLEAFVEKLCVRFRSAKTERQWRDLAFCLAQIQYSEKGIRKLQENLTCYGDKLYEDDVYESFLSILNSSKKGANLKPELKVVIEEFGNTIEELRSKGVSEEELVQRAQKLTRPKDNDFKTPGGRKLRATPRTAKSAKVGSETTPLRRTARSKQKEKLIQSILEDDDDEDDEEASDQAPAGKHVSEGRRSAASENSENSAKTSAPPRRTTRSEKLSQETSSDLSFSQSDKQDQEKTPGTRRRQPTDKEPPSQENTPAPPNRRSIQEKTPLSQELSSSESTTPGTRRRRAAEKEVSSQEKQSTQEKNSQESTSEDATPTTTRRRMAADKEASSQEKRSTQEKNSQESTSEDATPVTTRRRIAADKQTSQNTPVSSSRKSTQEKIQSSQKTTSEEETPAQKGKPTRSKRLVSQASEEDSAKNAKTPASSSMNKMQTPANPGRSTRSTRSKRTVPASSDKGKNT